MSGRQPIAVKECADKQWGDWRPHLAMILSNPSGNNSNDSGVDRRSIVTLGDTLADKGFLHAAHFCYLMANLPFGAYSSQSNAKLVLIGAERSTDKSFEAFATNEAIQTTEIFEYVQKLSDPDSHIWPLQYFKYIYAIRLLDAGMSSTALYYLEQIATAFAKHPELITGDCGMSGTELATHVLTLSDRLKYLDPVYTTREGEISEMADPEWVGGLRNVLTGSYQSYDQSYYQEQTSQDYYQEEQAPQEGIQQEQPLEQEPQQLQQQEQQQQLLPPMPQQVEPEGPRSLDPGMVDQPPLMMKPIPEEQEAEATSASLPPMMNPSALGPPNAAPVGAPPTMMPPTNFMQPLPPAPEPDSNSDQGNYFSNIKTSSAPPPMPNSAFQPKAKAPPMPSAAAPKADSGKKPAEEAKKKPKKVEEKKDEGPGILGRFIGRFIKPPNQVHLPDDTSNTIYYDEDLKKWVDKNADPAEVAASNAPPPSDMELSRNNSSADVGGGGPGSSSSAATTPMGGAPPSLAPPGMPGMPPPAGGNKFSAGLGKRRGLAGRIDVFKNSQSAPALSPSDGNAPPMMPPVAPGGGGGAPSLFVPGPPPPEDPANNNMAPMPEVNDNNVPGGTGDNGQAPAPMMFFNPNAMAGATTGPSPPFT